MDQAARILIVDDEPSLLKMMSTYLRRLGHAVTVANSSQKAWSTVQSAASDFDVAVIDATMTGMSMEELALNALSANPRLFILAASGYPVDMSKLEAAAPGRVAFLHKPFAPEKLAAAVRRVFATQKENL